MEVSSLILFDRSRVTCDWECERRRYYAYEYAGIGLASAHTSLELFLGTTIHDSFAAIATQQKEDGKVDIDLIASTAQKQMYQQLITIQGGEPEAEAIEFANEQSTLVEGLVRGFFRHCWPKLLQQYPVIIAIEPECTYKLDSTLTFMARPDLILADNEGSWTYIEYKTTSSKKDTWINSWDTAVQLHSSIKAVEQTLGTAPVSVIVQGAFKGFESYGKQSSVFCYGYHRAGNPPFSHSEMLYEYKSGYRRYPTWTMEGGVKAWVEGMPENVLADQFPQTPPIFINDDLVDSFFAQRATREAEIKLACHLMESADEIEKKQILDCAFEQNFAECVPGWGRPCGYRQLCHGHITNPLESGWSYREAHHQLEKELHEQRTVNNLSEE